MGTTKLTRKEILAEDPVHGSMIMLVDFFSKHKKLILVTVAAAIVIALGIYGGLFFLNKKEVEAQEILGRGIDFYHAKVDPEAPEDPYGKGSVAEFKTDALKYQAAAKEFKSIASGFGYGKVSPIARYYLGLTELELGNKEEGIADLKAVSEKSKGDAIGNLAETVLARVYAENGNSEEAKKILEALIQDASYELPKEELRIELAQILAGEGKYEGALKVLQDGVSQASSLSPLRQRMTTELEKVQKEIQLEKKP